MTRHSPPAPGPAREMLAGLPEPERREALETLVTSEFKEVLLMTEDEELPPDQSYFDLGLTSLSITGLKQRLERQLGVELDATLLFNSPTLEALLTQLTDDLLRDLFPAPAAVTAEAPAPAPVPAAPAVPVTGPGPATEKSYLDAALKNLYGR